MRPMMAESQLKVWRAFKHDVILVENGTTAMAGAFGCGIGFSEDTAPRVIDPVLKSLDDVDKLQIPDSREARSLMAVQRAVSILRRELGNEVFIMGRADQAPMALAACLRGHETFLLDLGLTEDPKAIERLLDICLDATTRYAFALQEAGAHGTCIGEFGTDVISPTMYRKRQEGYRRDCPRLTLRRREWPVTPAWTQRASSGWARARGLGGWSTREGDAAHPSDIPVG